MSGPLGSNVMMQPAAGGSNLYDYQIEQSIRMDDNSSDHLRRTPSSAGNRTTWSFSVWFKRSILTTFQMIFEAGNTGNQDTRLFWATTDSSDSIQHSSGEVNYGSSTAQLRDISAWNHFFIKHSSNTNVLYINGNQIKSATISGNTAVNSTVEHAIGSRASSGSSNFWNGYMAEVLLFDGTAYDPTDVAENKNGVWVPKDPSSLSFGTNGVHLKFENASDLGNDSSGNNNDYTSSGFGTDHQVLDSPTAGTG